MGMGRESGLCGGKGVGRGGGKEEAWAVLPFEVAEWCRSSGK